MALFRLLVASVVAAVVCGGQRTQTRAPPSAGSGYLTAVMGEMVGEGGHVLGVERHAEARPY